MTDLKKLKQLVKLMVDNDLTELDLEGEGDKIRLRRSQSGEVQYVPSPAMPTGAPPQPAPPSTAAAPPPTAPSASASVPGEDQPAPGAEPTIDSPMVGTFYSAPSPDAKSFVSVGDKVGPETIICVIEAMKVFNEIKAETSGTIRKVLVENGQAVEFGQNLFAIEPD